MAQAIRSAILIGALAMMTACADDDPGAKTEQARPLQPLIYTEYPDLTPEGAAVRERRLSRQLLEGRARGDWGTLDDADPGDLPPLDSAQALGEALAKALLEQDESLWEYAFVDARSYADLVNVGDDDAREFVDNQLGHSQPLWALFDRHRSSQVPEGGLGAQVQFAGLEMGRARDIDGNATDDPEKTVQFWNNRLVLEHRHRQLRFELPIERIFYLPTAPPAGQEQEDSNGDGSDGDRGDKSPPTSMAQYQVASPVAESSRLRTFLALGLHLKPQLLRPEEYPFPLGVGTFWRYRRFDASSGGEVEVDPLARRFDERPEGLQAEQVIVEVREVSNYGPLRLVELLRSYNDSEYTRLREWWVLTPRRIYLCTESCRDNIEDLNALLDYFSQHTALLQFPLGLGDSWGPAERSDFSVADQWHQVVTPAGSFAATFQIAGTGALGTVNPFFRNTQLLRDFAPGRGIVRRQIFAGSDSLESVDVVEELAEYRLMH